MAGHIYEILNSKTKQKYIGLTTEEFPIRRNRHFNDLRNGNHSNGHLQNSWNKYGEDSFLYRIVEFFDDPKELAEAEIFYIDLFKSFNPENGFNKTMGGELNLPTRETIEKKISSSKKVSLAVYSLDGNLINTYPSIKQASRELGIKDNQIHRACKKLFACKNLLFRKGDKIENRVKPYNPHQSAEKKYKKVFVFSRVGELLREFVSQKEASQILQIPRRSIVQSIKNNCLAYGFYFSKTTSFEIRGHKNGTLILELNNKGEEIARFFSFKKLSVELKMDQFKLKKQIEKTGQAKNRHFLIKT